MIKYEQVNSINFEELTRHYQEVKPEVDLQKIPCFARAQKDYVCISYAEDGETYLEAKEALSQEDITDKKGYQEQLEFCEWLQTLGKKSQEFLVIYEY